MDIFILLFWYLQFRVAGKYQFFIHDNQNLWKNLELNDLTLKNKIVWYNYATYVILSKLLTLLHMQVLIIYVNVWYMYRLSKNP